MRSFSTTNILAAEKSALDIMKKAFQHTGSMDRYAFIAVIVDHDVQEDGTIIPYKYNTSVKVDRPGNLRVDTKSEFLDSPDQTVDHENFKSMLHEHLFHVLPYQAVGRKVVH